MRWIAPVGLGLRRARLRRWPAHYYPADSPVALCGRKWPPSVWWVSVLAPEGYCSEGYCPSCMLAYIAQSRTNVGEGQGSREEG
jgi:hypothetical protein